jgi:hypothetical protein
LTDGILEFDVSTVFGGGGGGRDRRAWP